MTYLDQKQKEALLRSNPAKFIDAVFPDLSRESRGQAIAALKRGKRVCIWTQMGYVMGSRPPFFSTDLTDDCRQPAGDYGYLVIIDALKQQG